MWDVDENSVSCCKCMDEIEKDEKHYYHNGLPIHKHCYRLLPNTDKPKPKTSIYKGNIKGGKWLGIYNGINTVARKLNLSCELSRETTILTEHVKFKVSGESSRVKRFKLAMEQTARRLAI